MLYPNMIAEIRRRRLTIKELAGNLGLSADAIRFKLRGESEFTLSEIENMATLFGCSMDYLVGHQIQKPISQKDEVKGIFQRKKSAWLRTFLGNK